MADEFDTDKGIKENYDGKIRDAFFQAGEQGRTNLVLMVDADDGEEVEAHYAIGPDWASFDGGVTVEHPSKNKIRADSQLATLVERAMLSGAEAVIRERSSQNGGFGQRTAKLWPGLKFHWDVEAKAYDFKDREGNQVAGTSYKSYPTKFLGEGSSTSGDNSGDNSEGLSTGDAQVPDEIIVRLKVLAAAKPFAEWVDEALTIDYVRDNMLTALSDEGFYNSLKGN